MKFKMPSIKLPNFRRSGPPPRPRTLRATAARAGKPAYDEYDDDGEPTTRLSSAFIVVLVLHLVAVGGIYAFNGIKAHRKTQEVMNGPVTTPAKPAPVVDKSADAAYAATATPAPVIRPQPMAAAAPAPSGRVHHVHAGDTIAKLAVSYNVSAGELATQNNLKESAPLHVGQTLAIPAPKKTAAAPVAATANEVKKEAFLAATRDSGSAPKTYTVGKGENPVAIARKLGVSYDELIKLNKIDDPKKLQIGQVLKVPAKAKPAAESAG